MLSLIFLATCNRSLQHPFASPSPSSCDHITSQFSSEEVYAFDIIDHCCLGLFGLLIMVLFFTSPAAPSHSPSLSFKYSQMRLGSVYDLLCLLQIPPPQVSSSIIQACMNPTFISLPPFYPEPSHNPPPACMTSLGCLRTSQMPC